MKRKTKGAPRPYVDPPSVPARNRLPAGWEPATHHYMDEGEADASESPARQNAARLLAELHRAAIAALERTPQIRTGSALRIEMEGDAQSRKALAFSDPESIDRLLAGIVKIYKLNRTAR